MPRIYLLKFAPGTLHVIAIMQSPDLCNLIFRHFGYIDADVIKILIRLQLQLIHSEYLKTLVP